MANSNGWGDGAANNAIGWGQGANNAIGWGDIHADSWAGLTDIVGVTTDPDAQAFITAASITDPTQQSAINQLVVDLKGYNIWSKMKALYPFVGGTNAQHAWNLKNTAQYKITWYGGVTSSSNGITGNGTNGYGDTFLNNNVMAQNDTHISVYSRTNFVGTAVDIGSWNGGFGSFIYTRNGPLPGNFEATLNSTINRVQQANSDSRGFYLVTRKSSTSQTGQKNTTQYVTNISSNTHITTSFKLLRPGEYNGEYSPRNLAFASIGDGLTDTEAANFYTAVQAFQTTLGRQVGTPIPLTGTLLNDYPDAAAAYSLRKLRTAYTGSAIRVRRSSDNTEQDFGFVNNVLDTASLLTFCGAGNGFVTTWYDQSGNANNATQSTAANQPQIVSSGAMLTTNGKNSIKFDGSNDFLATTGTPFSAIENTLIAVSQQDATGSYRRLFNIGNYTNGRFLGSANGTDDMLAVFNNATFTCSGGVAITQNLSIMYNAGTNGVLRNNGSQVNTVTATNTSYGNKNLFIGNDENNTAGYLWNGIGQEFIFYPSSQATNVTGIESNINTFYTIY